MKVKWLGVLFGLLLLPNWLWGQHLQTRELVPGVRYTTIEDTLIPRHIFLLKINLREKNLHFQTVKAKNRLAGLARLSEMVRSFQAGRVVAALNGDFFNKSGIPLNFQAQRGEILREPIAYPVFGFTDSGHPFIRRLHLTGKLISQSGKSISVDGVNRQWQWDEMVYFNSFFGDSTLSNFWGTAVVLRALGKKWKAGRRRFRVIRISRRHKEAIPKTGAVLICHGQAEKWVNRNVQTGQTVRLLFDFSPLKDGVQEATGGLPQILTDGQTTLKFPKKDFTLKRHPRTAVGISKDGCTLFWVVVDGRQPDYSFGMTLPELADFLRKQGAYNALNLDGGGSTTIIVQGKIANHPSDAGGERPISNGWILFQK